MPEIQLDAIVKMIAMASIAGIIFNQRKKSILFAD